MPRYRACAVCGEPVHYNPARGGLEKPTCRTCRRHLRQRLCPQCGKQFEAKGGHDQQFCSRDCQIAAQTKYAPGEAKKAASRARKLNKAKTWDGVPDSMIYEAAGGVCQLGAWCKAPGMLIDPSAPKDNELYPNIDHIIPLSLGGIDVSANKRAAHRICDMSRGNRQTPEEIAFMAEHPELLLARKRLDTLPRREKTPKPPRLVKVCACEGCDEVLPDHKAAYCPACRVPVNRHRNQQNYYLKRGVTPPEPWWVSSGITEHQAHS